MQGQETSSRLVSRSQCSSPGAKGISGLHSRRTRGDRPPSRVEAKNPALLSSRDGYLLELTGWTQGSQASILLAMYLAVAERHGVPWARVAGTIQNDILKEYVARGTWIFPVQPSMRLIVD